MKREVWSVRWIARARSWVVRKPGGRNLAIGKGVAKSLALYYGRLACREAWDKGRLSQLKVYGKNGRIQFEHTYGRDPRRTKG